MEFTFDVREILQQDITKVTNSLIPPGFTGDRRKLWDTQNKLADIINAMGEASAAAQGLSKPITTVDRLKNSDHQLYLLLDHGGRQQTDSQKAHSQSVKSEKTNERGTGRVIGLLKTGRKSLYIFDRAGEHYQLHPVCVLDFYVHEAVQRMGLGKRLFEYMLQEEGVQPVKLAIDRPSEKFLGFLRKHYGLENPIPQMNNFVVFDGFFPEKPGSQSPRRGQSPYRTNNNSCTPPNTSQSKQNGYAHMSQFGRYAAPRPVCSMGQIIHNHSPTLQPEYNSDPDAQSMVSHYSPKLERPRSLSIHTEDAERDIEIRIDPANENEDHDEIESVIVTTKANKIENINLTMNNVETNKPRKHVILNQHYSTENNIIPAEKSPTERISRTPSNLTDHGFVDLKFYHSRLW